MNRSSVRFRQAAPTGVPVLTSTDNARTGRGSLPSFADRVARLRPTARSVAVRWSCEPPSVVDRRSPGSLPSAIAITSGSTRFASGTRRERRPLVDFVPPGSEQTARPAGRRKTILGTVGSQRSSVMSRRTRRSEKENGGRDLGRTREGSPSQVGDRFGRHCSETGRSFNDCHSSKRCSQVESQVEEEWPHLILGERLMPP
jgi:hypothetical protein